MAKTTISVQRGLMELKTLGNRINRATQQAFVTHYVGDEGAPQGFKTPQEFADYGKARYESVTDLIKRRNEIKAAIIASNAVTEVTVGDKKMTVAEAIDRKDAIVHEKVLLQQLKSQFSSVTREIAMQNQNMELRIAKRIEDEVGKDKKVDDATEEVIVRNTKKRYEPHLVDPIGIRKEIDRLETDIDQFELEVDVALSEINARTEIEISE
ncbi:hypothetical protein BCP8-2_026 [Bacillus phage BCP8-2]|uniref:Uncharacterized protein n=1 Tax=Bacillus phage BCP8-2 TaxID=1129192 RepID=A0A0E3D986_9CAUD|nr:tail fiber protein [Bacillus phage BCP8-2]AHJ87064.1 hypothetical protein BCP8-2_026 [Bacillus phage BCP8-2]